MDEKKSALVAVEGEGGGGGKGFSPLRPIWSKKYLK